MKYDGLVNEIEGEFQNHQTRGNMLLNQINKIIEPGFHHDLVDVPVIGLRYNVQRKPREFLLCQNPPMENHREEISEMLNMLVVQQRNIRFNDTACSALKT
jgi:hypothetical protein